MAVLSEVRALHTLPPYSLQQRPIGGGFMHSFCSFSSRKLSLDSLLRRLSMRINFAFAHE
jgi:hypothetical protein